MKIFTSRRWQCAVASTLTILTIACSDPQVTKEKQLAKGNLAFEKRQYAEAILAYRNVLKIDPGHGVARQKLVDAYEYAGDFRNASREAVRAADVLANDADAQVRAAQFLLMGRQFEDAATRARRAIEIDARSVAAHILLGSAIAGTKDFDGAMKELQEALAIDPSSGATHLNVGALLLAQGRKPEARASFEKAITLDPNSVPARLALAIYHLNAGDIREAEEAVKRALAVAPADGPANRAMALLLISAGRDAEAEPFVKNAVSSAGTPEAELSLADYYVRVKRLDAAKQILERLTGSEKLFAPASIRLAAIDYVTERRDDAHKRLDNVIERLPGNAEALVIKAQWTLIEGRHAEALKTAQAAVNADPGSASAQFILGRTRAMTDDRKGAEEAFAEVLRLNPRAGAAQTELARLNLAAGRVETGVQFAQDAVNNDQKNIEARVLLVRGLIARREIGRADAELAPLLRAFPEHPVTQGLHGTLLALKRDIVGAKREYDRALQRDSAQVDALAGVTALDVQAGQVERARQRLAAQLARTPKNTAVLLIAAQTDLHASDLKAGEEKLRQVVLLDPSLMSPYNLLARVYFQQGRLEEARKEFERIVERDPRAVGAHTVTGMILQSQNRDADAELAYGRALEVDPSAPVAANNLAYLYAERNHNLDEALRLARAAAERLKDNAPLLDTLGWVYYKRGQAEDAIPQFQASIQKEPGNPIYHYHLGLAYVQVGEQPKAKRALEAALRLNPSFPGADAARRALASLTD